MTDLTKLADALELKGQSWQELKDREEACREAARILRAAGAADVAKLMMLHDVAAETRRVLISGGNVPQNEADRSRQTRAALESALRVALAPPLGFVMVPVEPTPEMLEAGAGTKYEKRARNVWRDMIAAAAPKGTP